MTQKNLVRIASTVGLILFIISIANFTVDGWNWGFFDFVFAGIIFFAVGSAIDFALRKSRSTSRKVFATLAILIIFLLIWTELAVDAVSQFVKMLFN